MGKQSTGLPLIALLLVIGVPAAHAGINFWTNHGPEQRGILALTVDPATPNTLYAGTDGGAFKSTDGGVTWNAMGLDLATTIWVIAIDPTTPSTLYAGTLYAGGDLIGGVWKSTDGGATWSATGLDPNMGVAALAIDPTRPSTVYAGGAQNGKGVLKSMDGGTTWFTANNGLMANEISALAIDPAMPATLYAAGGGIDVFKSTDGGDSWKGTGLNANVSALAIDPHSPSTVYAAAATFTGGAGGVFKSIDGGTTWSATALDPSFDVVALALDSGNPAILYAGDSGQRGVFKSTDAGATWEPIDSGLTTAWIRALAIDPFRSNILYAGGCGVFKSTDSGDSWASVNHGFGIDAAANVTTLTLDPGPPTTIYAGTEGCGVFRSSDRGATWQTVTTGLLNTWITALALNRAQPSVVYAGTAIFSGKTTAGVFKSTNGASSWSAVNEGLESKSNVSALIVDPAVPTTLYAGTYRSTYGVHDGVFKSSDGGATWAATDTGLTDTFVTAMAIDPADPATLYTGIHTVDRVAGVFKSTDGGHFWNPTDLVDLKATKITALVIDPTTPTMVYASTSGFSTTDCYGGVLKSIDGGATWNATGLNDHFVDALLIDPTMPTTLYAGTGGEYCDDGNVFKSIDGGATWYSISAGLDPREIVNTLAIDPSNPTMLYAGITGMVAGTSGGVYAIQQMTECAGDCSGTQAVTVNDLMTLVNIALGTAQPAACPNGLPIGGDFDIAVIIQAVSNVLNGCSGGQR